MLILISFIVGMGLGGTVGFFVGAILNGAKDDTDK